MDREGVLAAIEARPCSVVFARERLAQTWDEALPIIRQNHAETGALPAVEFAPDRKRYEALEAVGMLEALTARRDGRLVGYALFVVDAHMDYPKTTWAVQSAMFVLPEFRSLPAVKFILWQDLTLWYSGVDLVYRHSTSRHDYSKLLRRLGYKAEEQRFVRDLRVGRAA